MFVAIQPRQSLSSTEASDRAILVASGLNPEENHTDHLSPEQRSKNMARIRDKDTAPEMFVRLTAHRLGFRYRLHVQSLPGRPDLVFPRLKKVIQVYGCYWHPHGHCRFSHQPRSRANYWLPKLKKNVERDARNVAMLRERGWAVLIIRECELTDVESLADRLRIFLS